MDTGILGADVVPTPVEWVGSSVYVLHAFQKKSTHGSATPKREIDLIRRRLAAAERRHHERQKADEEDHPNQS